jgi:hypothetical protein
MTLVRKEAAETFEGVLARVDMSLLQIMVNSLE